jgi:hypothetical protein
MNASGRVADMTLGDLGSALGMVRLFDTLMEVVRLLHYATLLLRCVELSRYVLILALRELHLIYLKAHRHIRLGGIVKC